MRLYPLILVLVTPALAGLTLPEPVKDYHVPADAASTAEFSVDFPFTNATFTARIHVPELVKIEPRPLCWDLGQPAKPQTLRIRIDHGKPILFTKVTCTTENFRHTLRTLTPGKLYEIEAVPVNSAILGLAVLKLETDCTLPRQSLHQAFLVVRKPPARPAAP